MISVVVNVVVKNLYIREKFVRVNVNIIPINVKIPLPIPEQRDLRTSVVYLI